MIKDKLHTLTDEDSIAVATILLKNSIASLFEYTFETINRFKFNPQDGVDAEEAIYVNFTGKVKNEAYKKSGWRDNHVIIKLIESDRYHAYPYFSGMKKDNDSDKMVYNDFNISNYIEATEFLQSKGYL